MHQTISQRVAARFTLDRSFYLPSEVRDKKPLTPDGTDLAIWTYEVDRGTKIVPYAIAFQAKQSKPIWHHSFSSESARQNMIDKTVDNRRRVLKIKEDSVRERKEYQHDYKVGDILKSSWGYEQTNVNYYEVVKVLGKQIVLREIGTKLHHSQGSADYVIPAPGKFIGPPIKRQPGVGGYVRIDQVQSAGKWDGRPAYETAAGWGH